MATAIAGVSGSPIIIKALVQLAEFGQPPSCQKTASGKQPYHWRHEIAAGWREKFNFKPRKAVPHSQKPHWVSTFYAEAGFRLRMKTQSLSYHGKYFKNHLQKVWLEIGTAKQCSTAPRGKFLQFSGCFPWLIWLQQKVPGKEQGNQNSPSRGFGHAWCLGGVLLGLIGWFLFGVVLDFWKKIKDGAGSCMGRGTEGSPGHTCSSYGDKRIVWEVGLLLWVPLETALAAEYCSFVRLPLPRILDYLWLSEFLSHKVDFLSAPERTTGSLTALSCLWKEARIQSAHNKSSRKIPQFLLDVLPSK